MPRIASSMVSCGPTSAKETLKRSRILSRIFETIERLALRSSLPLISITKRPTPTMKTSRSRLLFFRAMANEKAPPRLWRRGAGKELQSRCDLLDRVAGDHIAHLHVAESVDGESALEALEHFAGVVLEAAQRADLAVEDD